MSTISQRGLEVQRALVTGATSGIGRAVAVRLARDGAEVVVHGRNAERGADTVREITAAGGKATFVAADLTDAADVQWLASEVGDVDILINNAGIGAVGTVADNPDDQWHQVFDVNVVGMVRVTRAALPYLRRSGRAAIVNTCSIAATAGLPQRALYSATKGAVLSLTLAMAADHIHEGIRVNCVNPGTADTPWIGRLLAQADDPAAERAALEARQPLGRMVSADEVAAGIAYLASPAAAAVTGTALEIDGGMAGLRLRPRS